MRRFVKSNKRFLYDVIISRLIYVKNLKKKNQLFNKNYLINKILNMT